MKFSLAYDPWQFAHHSSHPRFAVEREEFARMQTRRSYGFQQKQEIPLWVFSTTRLREVVAAQVAQLAGLKCLPSDLSDIRRAGKKALWKLARDPNPNCHQLARAARMIGLPAYYAAILYRTYRLGLNSVEVGVGLGITSNCVRQTLHRLKIVEKRLTAGTFFERVYYVGRIPKSIDVQHAKALHNSGLPWDCVAAELKTSYQTLVRAFKRAGIKMTGAMRSDGRPNWWVKKRAA